MAAAAALVAALDAEPEDVDALADLADAGLVGRVGRVGSVEGPDEVAVLLLVAEFADAIVAAVDTATVVVDVVATLGTVAAGWADVVFMTVALFIR